MHRIARKDYKELVTVSLQLPNRIYKKKKQLKQGVDNNIDTI